MTAPAVPAEACWKERRALSASERATARAPRTLATAPATTTSRAIARRGQETFASDQREAWAPSCSAGAAGSGAAPGAAPLPPAAGRAWIEIGCSAGLPSAAGSGAASGVSGMVSRGLHARCVKRAYAALSIRPPPNLSGAPLRPGRAVQDATSGKSSARMTFPSERSPARRRAGAVLRLWTCRSGGFQSAARRGSRRSR